MTTPFQGSSEESYESGEAKYSFNYAVDHDPSSNEFGHQETRSGEETRGSYYVELPDGRLQVVKYFVDEDSGYVAEVTYTGEAQHPAYTPGHAYKLAHAYAPPHYG